jgi:hypothetical protein
MLEKRAVEECPPDFIGVISPMFVVIQKKKKRPVWDGQFVNSFMKKEHFKMESLNTVKETILREDWMTVLDIKDAYFHIPLSLQAMKLLQFQWREKTYRFRCMPFSISSAPRVFTKMMKLVLAQLRLRGLRIVGYIDDFLVFGRTQEEAFQNTFQAIQLLMKLGWTINWDKSKLIPQQSQIFLGMVVNSYNMFFKVPAEKMKNIKRDIMEILADPLKPIKLRHLARIIGKLMALELAILPTRLKTWKMLRWKNQHLVIGWEGKLRLSSAVIKEIQWWKDNITNWNGRAIILKPPQRVVTSDASELGWGGWTEDQETQGFWSVMERKYSNNVRELLAGKNSLQAFESTISGKVVLLQMDNTTAISYVNKMGGRVELLHQIAQDLWDWALQRNIVVVPKYIPGKENIRADTLSRKFSDRNDWMLNPALFKRLDNLWGPHQVDLFATKLNRQVQKFFSWHPEPESSGVDAFQQSWKKIQCWANPPFNQIGKVLIKTKQDKADLTIIAPIWITAPWFPSLLQLCRTWPIILPHTKNLFLPGFLGNQNPLDHPNWRAAAFSISGNQECIREFQTELSLFLQEIMIPIEQSRHTNLPGFSLLSGTTHKALMTGLFHQIEW